MTEIATDCTEAKAREYALCQKIAESLWEAGTSDNNDIAGYRTTIYRNLERAFTECVRVVYGLGATRAGQVRELLSEYGPHDSLQGTNGRGIASYVEFVKANPGRRF